MQLSKGFYKWGWVIIEGCTNNCDYCYARKIIENRGRNFDKPVFNTYLLNEPFKIKPARIFVNYLGDIMCVPDDWVKKIIDVCKRLPDHTFIFMTKLSERYEKFAFPGNCVLGVTIESPDKWYRAEIMAKYANRKMCSVEPILGNFAGYDFSQFEFVVVGSLIENNTHEFYDTVKHDKIYYTR